MNPVDASAICYPYCVVEITVTCLVYAVAERKTTICTGLADYEGRQGANSLSSSLGSPSQRIVSHAVPYY